jgi:hypothetical protein
MHVCFSFTRRLRGVRAGFIRPRESAAFRRSLREPLHGHVIVKLAAINGSVSRRIALIAAGDAGGDDRSQRAMQLLDTMLWVLKGTTNAAWIKAQPDEADIVVVHQDDSQGDKASGTAAEWQARGKLVVQIAAQSANDKPGDAAANPNTLVYPFRAVDVLSLLERLNAQLDADLSSPAAADRTPDGVGSEDGPWKFVEALRAVRDVRNSEQWLAAHRGTAPVLWLRGDGAVYRATAQIVDTIRSGKLALGALSIQPASAMPVDVPQRSGFELGWYAGLFASHTLAPWLSSTTKYRLRQWPNFGSIRPTPAVLKVVSALASSPASVDDLVARSGLPATDVIRAFNALSTCESIVEVEAVRNLETKRPATAAPSGGFTKFLKRVRKHLGLEATA